MQIAIPTAENSLSLSSRRNLRRIGFSPFRDMNFPPGRECDSYRVARAELPIHNHRGRFALRPCARAGYDTAY